MSSFDSPPGGASTEDEIWSGFTKTLRGGLKKARANLPWRDKVTHPLSAPVKWEPAEMRPGDRRQPALPASRAPPVEGKRKQSECVDCLRTQGSSYAAEMAME